MGNVRGTLASPALRLSCFGLPSPFRSVLWVRLLSAAFLLLNIRLFVLAALPEDALRAQSLAGCLGSGALCWARRLTELWGIPARMGSSEDFPSPLGANARLSHLVFLE